MEPPRIIHGYLLSLFFTFQLGILPQISYSLSQGKGFPYVTSDVTEVSGKSFDYIVVGGGTAGCPLAATLSEKFSVLLVERGGSPYQNPFIEEMKYAGVVNEFSSVAQRFVSQDGVENFRGRVLGGSSAINHGFYSRASDDFVTRAGWDRELVEEAFEWIESRIVSKSIQLSKFQSALKSGFLEAGIQPYNGFTFEHIPGTKNGASTFDHNGKRHTSADLLLSGNSENLIVLLNATVKNIIFHSNGGGDGQEACGISFFKSDGSIDQTYEAYLKKPENSTGIGDVILSAGAIGSPQILLLSGIGPEIQLEEFGIPLVLDLEGVGKKMQDNPRIDRNLITTTGFRPADIPQVAAISEHIKFIAEGAILQSSFNETATFIAIKHSCAKSEGYLELNNTDPRQNPLVKFNYFENQKDLDECVVMVQLLEKMATSESITDYIMSQNAVPMNDSTPSDPGELREFCKKNVVTFYHYYGGCTVGSVVDHDSRVYGIKGLRVVDASTFLSSPGTNPAATLLMLGRYQGIKILKERVMAECRSNI